jgi:hypothetical protein
MANSSFAREPERLAGGMSTMADRIVQGMTTSLMCAFGATEELAEKYQIDQDDMRELLTFLNDLLAQVERLKSPGSPQCAELSCQP